MPRVAKPAQIIAGLILAAVACIPPSSTPDAGAPNNTQTLCTTSENCAEFEQCVGGVCQRPCGTHDVCDFGQFCNGQGYCQEGCRDTSSCPDAANQLCVDGVCRNRSEVGACATKTDCTDPPDTKVCKDNVCVDPPASCTGPQDCPGTLSCNGFSNTCFDPNGDCTTTADCAGKPHCANGCQCTQDRRCVETPTCTLADEPATCGNDSYCDTTLSTPRCTQVPVCNLQADCNDVDLACNRVTHQCQRTPTCNASGSCAQAPFTHCNATDGYCQEPSCINGGTTCSGTQTCQTDGTCGSGPSTSCTTHSACPATQYCDGATALCKTGCRDDTGCTSPEKCNGAHLCAVPSGSSSSGGGTGGTDGAACEGDADCRSGYRCSPFIGVCRETCTGSCPECPETGYGCYGGGFCSPLAEPPAPCP